MQEKLSTTLRANHENLEDDYYKQELDLQEAKAALQKSEKFKDTLGNNTNTNTNTNTNINTRKIHK